MGKFLQFFLTKAGLFHSFSHLGDLDLIQVCIAPAGGYFVLFDSGGWAHNSHFSAENWMTFCFQEAASPVPKQLDGVFIAIDIYCHF